MRAMATDAPSLEDRHHEWLAAYVLGAAGLEQRAGATWRAGLAPGGGGFVCMLYCRLCGVTMCSVSKHPVVEPKFERTLEWVLPTPVPLHQFEESPIVIEVKNRNPEHDDEH
jgi:hypothetical protein